MHWLDCGVGAVIDRLEKLRLLDNTFVILFSDNNQRGKETLYEGGARVPLLMTWPKRIVAGSRCDRVVANVDFAPTILDACGITPPEDMILDGRSVLPILDDALRGATDCCWKTVARKPSSPIVGNTSPWHPPDVQAMIDEVDRTENIRRLSPKANAYFEKFQQR